MEEPRVPSPHSLPFDRGRPTPPLPQATRAIGHPINPALQLEISAIESRALDGDPFMHPDRRARRGINMTQTVRQLGQLASNPPTGIVPILGSSEPEPGQVFATASDVDSGIVPVQGSSEPESGQVLAMTSDVDSGIVPLSEMCNGFE